MFYGFDWRRNNQIYGIHGFQRHMLKAYFNTAAATFGWQASLVKSIVHSPFMPKAYSDLANMLSASAEMSSRICKDYPKPEFGIKETKIGKKTIAVHEEVALDKDFGSLLHFKRDTNRNDPAVLLVAPMSGHYATLLRDTVDSLLPHHDVYITDWKDARDIPLSKGDFGIEDYMSYVQDFIEYVGPQTHVLAVCQPTVPVLGAVSALAADNNRIQPLSMTLMGGPIDTRAAKTAVTEYAERHSIQFFRNHVIAQVPHQYKGSGRLVYPGFMQLAGFMSMNPDRHVNSHRDLFNHLCLGQNEEGEKIKAFYDEYLAVCDLPAKFYLETVNQVFQTHALPRGEMLFKGRKLDPSGITDTALMTVEGELDDISAPGQTFAAHGLCSGLKKDQHYHYLQEKAGHYGIFNGRRWREEIRPRIAGFIRDIGAKHGITYDSVPGTGQVIQPDHANLSLVKKIPHEPLNDNTQPDQTPPRCKIA